MKEPDKQTSLSYSYDMAQRVVGVYQDNGVTLRTVPMNLIMFDIDDTLVQSMQMDEQCFVRALEEVFGFCGVNHDWSVYTHTTDPGILGEIFVMQVGRPPTGDEVARFQSHFVALLSDATAASPLEPVPGAPAMLSRLTTHAGTCASLATGAWRASARIKMASAGIRFDDFPSATGDDADSREAIMRRSIERTMAWAGNGRFTGIVYVGDGVWDARACRSLGIPFVGIGTRARAEALTTEGAFRVFSDFRQIDAFLGTIREIGDRRHF